MVELNEAGIHMYLLIEVLPMLSLVITKPKGAG